MVKLRLGWFSINAVKDRKRWFKILIKSNSQHKIKNSTSGMLGSLWAFNFD